MKKKNSTAQAATTKENLEERFDDGEDVLDHFDTEGAILMHPSKKVSTELPSWAVAVFDREAARLCMPRGTLMKVWLLEKADALQGK